MGPINYLAGMPQIDLGASLQQGLQTGAMFGQIQAQQQAREQAMREAEEKQRRAEAFKLNFAAYLEEPTAKRWAGLVAENPGMREALGDINKTLTADQVKAEQRELSELYAALGTDPVIAAGLVDQRIQAAKNSGQPIEELEAVRRGIAENPKFVRAMTLGRLGSLPDGDKIVKSILDAEEGQRKAELQPIEIRTRTAQAGTAEAESVIRAADAQVAPQMSVAKLNEQLAKASKEAVAAKFAESRAVQDLKLGDAQIRALATDEQIKRQNVAIASMNAQTARAGNDLKRQELQLKLDEMVAKRDSTVREKIASAEASASTVDNMLNTIQRIKRNPRLNAVVGGIEGRTPAVLGESVDAIALIETLGSQAFLSQIPQIKGMGQLSNAEGDKLQAAFQNFSRVQSEKQFRANLDEATRLLEKARQGIAKGTGVALPPVDTPAAPASGGKPPLSSFLK